MQPSPDLSRVLQPSNYKLKLLLATKFFPILLLLLSTSILQDSLVPIGVQGRSSNYVSGRTGDGCT